MTEILPRENILPRPAIANIDVLLLIIPLLKPKPDLNVLDKMLVIAGKQNIPVEIIFTKYDLNDELGDELEEIYSNAGYEVHLSYPGKTELVEHIKELMQGKLLCLAGPSGAGKSTLLNTISGEELMETGEISRKMQRGKHTTRHVELFAFNKGYISDTPGFSSLDLSQAGIEEDELVYGYPEILELQAYCKFGNSCKHLKEPGCAVKESANIDNDRLERYQSMRTYLESVNTYDRRSY